MSILPNAAVSRTCNARWIGNVSDLRRIPFWAGIHIGNSPDLESRDRCMIPSRDVENLMRLMKLIGRLCRVGLAQPQYFSRCFDGDFEAQRTTRRREGEGETPAPELPTPPGT